MPVKTHDEMKAGIFIIAAIALLVAIILWLGVADVLRRSGQEVAFYIPADSLGAGVVEGSAVTIGGKKIGQVIRVEYQPQENRTIYIARLQRQDVQIYADGTASAVSGLVGGAEVAILDIGTSSQPLADAEHPIRISGGIQRAIADLSATLAMLRSTTETELNRDDPASLIAEIHVILDNLGNATDNIVAITEAIQAETDASRAESLMAQLHQLMEGSENLMPTITAAAEQLAGALADMRTMLNAINAGDGTLGAMVHDPRMYNGMVDAIEQLELLLTDLRATIAVWSEQGIPMQLK